MPAINLTPQPGDRISDTQVPILQNFTSINTAFNLNHSSFGTGNEGKHEFLQMPEQAGAPATLANEAGLYSAVGADSTVTELVFRRESNGTAIPFTESTLAATGWSRLPSGLIIKWGEITSNGATAFNVAQIVIYPAGAAPAFTTVYGVQISPRATGVATTAQYDTFAQPLDWTTSALQFTYLASVRTANTTRQTTFTYLAIGS